MNRSLRSRTEYKYEVLNSDEESAGPSPLRRHMGYLGRMKLFASALVGLAVLATLSAAQFGTTVDPRLLDACPGYRAIDVKTTANSLTASLVLAGKGCNVFGEDVERLSLEVTYETQSRVHVKITDPSVARYEVPESIVPRPSPQSSASETTSQIRFNFTASPFSFSIYRARTKEILFSSASHPLIFEPQYLRLKTSLPQDAVIVGLGEHTDPFRLPTHNTTRTMWSRDAYGVPPETNLYGNHPIYFEHRLTGTHGVFLLNSNGMDIKINDTEKAGTTTLEYNVIGGVLDFYFLAGSETDPTEVARQYAEIVGTPAEMPYWSFGLHQCRYGYTDFVNVAEVITNYSNAGIPLETMWTDIDYMFKRWIFTNDPDYFPTDKMREIVDYLHSHDQQYVLMTDPAVAYQPDQGYGTFDRGVAQNVFLKNQNGSLNLGVVWPGVTVFPDWFSSNIQTFWDNEYQMFFNPETGIDIDGAWIDMNEPSSFCDYPCTDPFESAREQAMPPPRTTSPPDPNTPLFGQPSNSTKRSSMTLAKRQHAGDNIMNPPYAINNALPELSDRTAYVNITHANGLLMYDTHNVFGTMMSTATRNAMINRRPGLRPLVITRSTFAGAGKHVGKWLGDNMSLWEHYRFSIAGMLGMASVYQIPMVGSDICGYAANTTETLCARWAMLGAFYPFMRNHNADTSPSQEFYLWPSVTQAAINALDMRYRLLDYIYTAFHQAHSDGTPVLNPLFYKYPKDPNTFGIDLQFLYGDSILVSPVTEENATSVDIYLPNDIFYEFLTLHPVRGHGANVTLSNVNFTSIPVHIRGGAILPLRVEGAMTTKELRTKDIEFVVASGLDGTASGSLYMDDGVSITPQNFTKLDMKFTGNEFSLTGSFGHAPGVNVSSISILNSSKAPGAAKLNGTPLSPSSIQYDDNNKKLKIQLGFELAGPFELSFA